MIVIEELLPRPETDDPELNGVEAWNIPESNAIVMTWGADDGTTCWGAMEDCSDWNDNGFADNRESAIFSGTMSGMERVAQRITQAYYKKLKGENK